MSNDPGPTIIIPQNWKHPLEDDYSDSQYERKPSGLIFYKEPGDEFKEVGATLKCPHCGGHFRSVKGSGHRRTFCMRHMAPLCDKPECKLNCTDAASREGILSSREL